MSQQDSSQVVVTLPDGSELRVAHGTTVEEIAHHIGEGLGRDTVAGLVDGNLVDKATELHTDSAVEIVTEDSDEYLRVLRHSAAHVFAQAVQRLYPEAKFAIGPPTDDGFYYDIASVDLDSGDLAAIEDEMEDIIEADYEIQHIEHSREEAIDLYADNSYKRDILRDEAVGEDPVSFYRQDGWQDLCNGPHVASTGKIGAVSLLNISSAYWRGDEENDSLTRVYGTAFSSEAELETFLERRKEARKRDHRKLGQELDLFSIPDHSPGCAQFHPNGMRIRQELKEYIRTKDTALGYEEVQTPALNKTDLWKPSGHYETFREEGEMFAWEQNDAEYGLKPMNCANHASIYGSEKRSYRELPIRYSEFGTVYRNERSGELAGLLRAREFTIDDGHAFVRRDQIREEIAAVLGIIEDIYTTFDLDVLYKLETKGDNAMGSDALWEEATNALITALESADLDYEVEEGEAAFYGPKIGIDAQDALNREWTIGTVQLDFNIPSQLGLSYIGEDNEEHQPVMVHRALLGSLERFVGVIIEHFAGDFPTWLAPEQARILPVSDTQVEYAQEVKEELSTFRVTVETRSWTIEHKIQRAHEDRVPYMLIVGDDEESAETVAVRDRQEREQRSIQLGEFSRHLRVEVTERDHEPHFLE